LIILALLALVAFLMDYSTRPREVCNEKGECVVYREKWVKMEVGDQGIWSLPKSWMKGFAMCGMSLYYTANNIENTDGPASIATIKIKSCKLSKWSKQQDYMLTNNEGATIIFEKYATCDENTFVTGFKIKRSIDSSSGVTFFSGFHIICGNNKHTLEGRSKGLSFYFCKPFH
jgi:hypothetical protein